MPKAQYSGSYPLPGGKGELPGVAYPTRREVQSAIDDAIHKCLGPGAIEDPFAYHMLMCVSTLLNSRSSSPPALADVFGAMRVFNETAGHLIALELRTLVEFEKDC